MSECRTIEVKEILAELRIILEGALEILDTNGKQSTQQERPTK